MLNYNKIHLKLFIYFNLNYYKFFKKNILFFRLNGILDLIRFKQEDYKEIIFFFNKVDEIYVLGIFNNDYINLNKNEITYYEFIKNIKNIKNEKKIFIKKQKIKNKKQPVSLRIINKIKIYKLFSKYNKLNFFLINYIFILIIIINFFKKMNFKKLIILIWLIFIFTLFKIFYILFIIYIIISLVIIYYLIIYYINNKNINIYTTNFKFFFYDEKYIFKNFLLCIPYCFLCLFYLIHNNLIIIVIEYILDKNKNKESFFLHYL